MNKLFGKQPLALPGSAKQNEFLFAKIIVGNIIRHKSARIGEILNPCHNFEIFLTLVFPE